MDKIEAMRVFARVAELGSFTRAADSLGLPKASVSTAVQRLETELGTRLFHRTTRRVELTQDGARYHERCRQLLDDVDDLDGLFRDGGAALRGTLRVDMSTGMARRFVIPALPEFLARHPQLQLELSSTDRMVDLVREGFDCVVRVGTLADSSLVARPLGAFRIMSLASPAYLAARGVPRTIADLDQHALIHYVPTLGAKSPGFEYRHGRGYATREMPGAVSVNNADAYEAACVAGLGIIQAPIAGLHDRIARGELVEVLPEFPAEPMPVSIVYAARRNLPRRVHVFMDWLAELLAPQLD